MSVAADSTLSAAAQQKIKDITQQMMSGNLSLADANSQANAIRSNAGANYTASAKGATVYNSGASSTTGSSSGTGSSYTENIAADSGLSSPQLSQIQSYRDQAKAGLISWDQANQAANAVRMAAGGYTVDKSGNASYLQQYQYPDFQSFLDATGYNQYSAKTQAAIQAAVNSAISGYQNQIDTTNTDSAELARQAYIAKMLGQKNLDQQLSASGYAGGMADSQKIQTEANYQNNLTTIENQRLATIKELQTAITQAQLSGDQQTADQLASELQNAQSQWASYVQNQNSLNASVASDNKSAAYTKAWNLLQMGQMPDSSTLEQAGISQTEAIAARTYYANLIAQQNASTAGTTSAAKTTGSTTKASSSTAKTSSSSYNNGVLTTDQVKQLQRYLGVTADGAWGSNSSKAADGMTADEAWAAYKSQVVNGSGLSDSAQSLRTQFGYSYLTQANKVSMIEQALKSGKITESDADALMSYIGY